MSDKRREMMATNIRVVTTRYRAGQVSEWQSECGHKGYGEWNQDIGCPVCYSQKIMMKDAIVEALEEYFGSRTPPAPPGEG